MRIRNLSRFSLRSLVFSVLTIVCAAATWHNREVWFLAHEHSIRDDTYWGLLPGGEEFGVICDQALDGVSLWNVRTGVERRSLPPLPAKDCIASTPSPGLVFMAYDTERQATILAAGREDPVCTVPALNGDGYAKFSPNGLRAVCICSDYVLRVFDIPSRTTRELGPVGKDLGADSTYTAKDLTVQFDFSTDGRWLSVAECTPSIQGDEHRPAVRGWYLPWRLYDCDSGRPLELPKEVDQLVDLNREDCSGFPQFFGVGQHIYVGRHRWDPASGRLEPVPGDFVEVFPQCQPPDFLTFRTSPESLEVWRADISQRVGVVPIPKGNMRDMVALSADGDRLVWENTVWSVPRGRVVARIPFDPAPTTAFCFVGEDHLICLRESDPMAFEVWRRRRPESEWGVLAQPEFYLLVLCAAGLLWSVLSDVRR